MSWPTAKYLTSLLTPPSTQPEDGQDWPKVEVLGRAKDEAQNKQFFEQIVQEIKDNVGCPARSWRLLPRNGGCER